MKLLNLIAGKEEEEKPWFEKDISWRRVEFRFRRAEKYIQVPRQTSKPKSIGASRILSQPIWIRDLLIRNAKPILNAHTNTYDVTC